MIAHLMPIFFQFGILDLVAVIKIKNRYSRNQIKSRSGEQGRLQLDLSKLKYTNFIGYLQVQYLDFLFLSPASRVTQNTQSCNYMYVPVRSAMIPINF